MLGEIAALKNRRGADGEVIQTGEKNYFASHAQRMNYQSIARRGWPIGSGAVESSLSPKAMPVPKRPGQFLMTHQAGFRHLAALDQARRNHHWEQLWSPKLTTVSRCAQSIRHTIHRLSTLAGSC